MHRPSVTLQLLNMEYREQHPDGYQYTQFCHHFRVWEKRLDVVMRQDHRASEKLFVDFAGKKTLKIINPATGEIRLAELVWLNERPFKKLPGSRLSWFDEIDRPALRPLCAAKGGIKILVNGMAADLADQGIGINAVAPSATCIDAKPRLLFTGGHRKGEQALYTLGRLAESGQPLSAAVVLASDDASRPAPHSSWTATKRCDKAYIGGISGSST